jgi:multidrug efflux system membrane fusion protein
MNRVVWSWASVLLVLCGCAREQQYEKPLTPVTLYKVEEFAGEARPTYSGTVEPASHVDVSFKSGGYVDRISTRPGGGLIQEGDFVEKGAVMATLRTKDYDIKVTEAKTQLQQAQAGTVQAEAAVAGNKIARDKAKADFERAGRMLKVESLTKVDYDGAKAAYDGAEQTLAAAQGQLDLARARVDGARALISEAEYALADTAIAAPISGTVFRRNIEVGMLVGPGTPGFTLADTSSVKIVFGAPDVLLSKLKPGLPLEVTTEVYPDVRFPAHINRIAPAADMKSRVFDVELIIPNQGNRLKAGMTVSIEVGEKTFAHPVPVVPLPAIVNSGGARDYSVFVVHDQGERTTVQRRSVQLGNAFGNRIAVTSGLNAGENVVLSGATLIREGETVRVVPAVQ